MKTNKDLITVTGTHLHNGIEFDWKNVYAWDLSPIICVDEETGKYKSSEWNVMFAVDNIKELIKFRVESSGVIMLQEIDSDNRDIDFNKDYYLPEYLKGYGDIKSECQRIANMIGDISMDKFGFAKARDISYFQKHMQQYDE